MLRQEQTAAAKAARIHSHPSLCDEGETPARALRAGVVSF